MLAAAQEGSEAAFSRLRRDGNPALLRYLRVMAPEAAEDVAADTWLQVVRGLAWPAPPGALARTGKIFFLTLNRTVPDFVP